MKRNTIVLRTIASTLCLVIQIVQRVHLCLAYSGCFALQAKFTSSRATIQRRRELCEVVTDYDDDNAAVIGYGGRIREQTM